MAQRPTDDLDATSPAVQDDNDSPEAQPQEGTPVEEIRSREDVIEDEELNDRFQATDN